MRIEPLSIVPYYGGKAKMSQLISDMLWTKDIEIFIVPFGGGARGLLNAPTYPVEIYNDSSAGMCCLIELLSNEETGMELIRRLYETEYSEDCFNQCLQYRNRYEDNFLQELTQELGKLLRTIDKEYDTKLYRKFNRQLKAVYLTKESSLINLTKDKKDNEDIEQLLLTEETKKKLEYYIDELNLLIKNYYAQRREIKLSQEDNIEIQNEVYKWVEWYCRQHGISLEDIEDKNNEFHKKYVKLVANQHKKLVNHRLKERFYETATNTRTEQLDMYNLAIATFVVYSQSRDGAGITFSKEKFATTDDYHKRIDNLYECMKRLQGVIVTQVDALTFFRKNGDYLNNEKVMIYCDPTYLKDSTIDSEDSDPLNEYNPGVIYKHYWTRAEHEKFLKIIKDAKCKLLVSNYDDKEHLYDSYLSGGRWHRFDFETTTTMSNSEDNQRTECLWYNYEIE